MQETYSNAASFKLATLETVAADPLLKPIDLALFLAYSKFMKWPKRTSYMPNTKARLLCGNASQPTISASRGRLVRAGYLLKVMDKLNGCTIFELNNPRAELVADHLVMAEETLKEWDANRKAKDRLKAKGVKEISMQNDAKGKRNFADRVKEIDDNSLYNTFEGEAKKGSNTKERSYGELSRGW